MDVTTAFLNGQLQEVCMEQPEGFVGEGQGYVVCGLRCGICGLKRDADVGMGLLMLTSGRLVSCGRLDIHVCIGSNGSDWFVRG